MDLDEVERRAAVAGKHDARGLALPRSVIDKIYFGYEGTKVCLVVHDDALSLPRRRRSLVRQVIDTLRGRMDDDEVPI